MEQMDLFTVVEEQEKETEAKLIFREWQGLPKEKFIHEEDPMRAKVRGELARWYCSRWAQALHRCAGLPDGKYIWLNYIEVPEYWVINDEGNPCGEHIETCPVLRSRPEKRRWGCGFGEGRRRLVGYPRVFERRWYECLKSSASSSGQSLPPERWTEAANNLEQVFPMFARRLELLNNDGMGKQDAQGVHGGRHARPGGPAICGGQRFECCRFIAIPKRMEGGEQK